MNTLQQAINMTEQYQMFEGSLCVYLYWRDHPIYCLCEKTKKTFMYGIYEYTLPAHLDRLKLEKLVISWLEYGYGNDAYKTSK